MNLVWLWDFIFQAWCDGVYLVGNTKFSWVECWQYFDLLQNSCWNLMKILDESYAMFGLVWLFGFGVCVFKPRMKCDYNASLLLECDVEYYWTCFIYEFLLWISLFMVSLPLFVCLCVCCMCDDRITCVLYGSRRQCRYFWLEVDFGKDRVDSGNYGFFCWFKSNSEDYEIFFWFLVFSSNFVFLIIIISN